MRRIMKSLTIFLTAALIFTACASHAAPENEKVEKVAVIAETVSTVVPVNIRNPRIVIKPEKTIVKEDLFSDEEIEAITKTLAGECYDDKLNDKRLVVEVILNRVASGRFGESVIEVVTAKGQFNGYWKQSRQISESDIRIAKEALHDWYANDCKKLSDYLYFSSGSNRENEFRTEY
jgi:spore germination cell wall hydrolase CwlJ-like protein